MCLHALTGEVDIPISGAVQLHLLWSLIKTLTTKLTQTLALIIQTVFMPSVFTTQVWIGGSETGANPFLMLLTAAWQHWNLGPPKLVL